MRHLTLAIFLLVSTMGFSQETPSSLRDLGLAAMKAAQSDPDQIVLAAKLQPIEVTHA